MRNSTLPHSNFRTREPPRLEFNCPTKLRRNELNRTRRSSRNTRRFDETWWGWSESRGGVPASRCVSQPRAEGNAPVTVQALALALG